MSEQATVREGGSPSVEAQVGARWWADKLRAGFVSDNGDPTAQGAMTSVLALTLRAKETAGITPEQVDAFEVALARRIQAKEMHGFGFGTDYHPDATLADSLSEAGIRVEMTTLPWKTMMWVRPGSVRVGDGYAAAPVELPLSSAGESS